eukprot:11623174-Prorocentrum_lima.AAC.1
MANVNPTRLTLLESHTELHHTRQGAHSTRGELAKSLRTSTTSIIALPALHIAIVAGGGDIHEVDLVLHRHDTSAQVHSMIQVNLVSADA